MKKILMAFLCFVFVLGMMTPGVLAGAPSDHDCFSQNGDIWCDICDEPMEHQCISNDGNTRCDLCDALIPHDCRDQNRDGSCDLCTRPCESVKGDLTGDGKVNTADVSKLYAHVKGSDVLTAETDLRCCDITGEGMINMADVSRLYAHVKGTDPLD